jgi:hypothetical protein
VNSRRFDYPSVNRLKKRKKLMNRNYLLSAIVSLVCVSFLSACGGGDSGSSSSKYTFPVLGVASLVDKNSTGGRYLPQAQVAMDNSGNALAVWMHYDGTSFTIWANHYLSSTAQWSTATAIATTASTSSYGVTVYMDAAGNGIAMWSQRDGTTDNIWLIAAGATPKMVFDTSGNAWAVWVSSGGISASRYTASSSTWGAVQSISSVSSSEIRLPQIAMDPNGNCLVVWYQTDGTRYNVWFNRFTAGTSSWGTAQLLESGSGSALKPQIAMDVNGTGWAVWVQNDGTRNAIWVNRYTANTSSWGTPSIIDPGMDGSGDPQIGIDGSGNALVVWYQAYGPLSMQHTVSVASRYTASTSSWGAPVIIGPMDGVAYSPQVAINGNGNAWVVWEQNDFSISTSNTMARSYSMSTSVWGVASLLENGAADASHPQVVINNNRNAMSVWNQIDGATSNIWSNRMR